VQRVRSPKRSVAYSVHAVVSTGAHKSIEEMRRAPRARRSVLSVVLPRTARSSCASRVVVAVCPPLMPVSEYAVQHDLLCATSGAAQCCLSWFVPAICRLPAHMSTFECRLRQRCQAVRECAARVYAVISRRAALSAALHAMPIVLRKRRKITVR